MPKAKAERQEVKPYDAAEGRKGGWGRKKTEGEGEEGEAAAVQGAGFKDKAKAEETVSILEGRDPCYAFYVVNSMFHRAKVRTPFAAPAA
jgi:hypothetical protein